MGISLPRAADRSDQLPPVEVSPPDDPNRTRAKPIADEGSGPRRAPAPAVAQTSNPKGAPANGPSAANATANRQFAGIVGASTTVITAQRYRPLARSNHPGNHRADTRRATDDTCSAASTARKPMWTCADSALSRPPIALCSSTAGGSTTSTWPASIFRPFRAIRSSALKSRAATAAPCFMATMPSAASSISSPRPAPAAHRPRSRRSRRRLLQPAHGVGLDRDQCGTVVGFLLWQRHQVRRIPGEQRARPAQRDRQPQLQHG